MRLTRLHEGLVLEDVEPASEVGVGLEVRHEGDLVHHRPSRSVHQNGVILHDGEPLLVDQVMGRLVEQGVEAHHIRDCRDRSSRHAENE